MIKFTMHGNISSLKYALKSVPGLAVVGVPHGNGDGPRTQEGSGQELVSNDQFHYA